MSDSELSILRRAYARRVYFMSGADDPRLEGALAEVRREDFLGPGPWDLPVGVGYRRTPDADLAWLYQDALVGIRPEKGLNNGMPSFVTLLISLGRIAEGEHAVHVGAGVGYYTAFLARLVGGAGRVTAIEYEPDLARRARSNLAAYPQAEVLQGDGTAMALAPADVILVNAGAARPADVWLDALKEGGRLILPLTVGYEGPGGVKMTRGAVFLIERRGEAFSAAMKSGTGIYPCAGMSDPESEASLSAAFRKGGADKVRRLYRGDLPPPELCWVQGPGWALAYE